MSRPIPAGDTIEHFDPELRHQRVRLLAVLEQLVAHEPQALEEGGIQRRLGRSTGGRFPSRISSTTALNGGRRSQQEQPAT